MPAHAFFRGGYAGAPAFVGGDACDGLALSVVDAIPLAVGAGCENNIGAVAVLNCEAHHRALLALDHVTARVEHRDDRNRQSGAGDVLVEVWHRGKS
jgi:hypothetical protein